MPNSNNYQKIASFVLFVIALFLFFNLIRPMIAILLTSVLLAYIAFPIHRRINRKIKNESFSIILSLSVIVIIVLIPFTFLAFEVTQQGFYFYNSLSDHVTKGALFGFGCTSKNSEVCLLINQAEKFSLQKLSVFGFDKQLQKLLPVLEEHITNFILSIPLIVAQIFLTLVISFFILKDWKGITRKISELLPMRKKTIDQLIKEFGEITYTVVYSQLFVAIVQGFVGALGFYFLGVPFPIFFGVIMAFCALIPSIGTVLIWLPASIFLITSGYYSNHYDILVKGIILFFYGLLVISVIDNILLAKIIHTKAKVNQIIIITGVIGGGALLGVTGIFIGPILLPLLITYFRTFKERFD